MKSLEELYLDIEEHLLKDEKPSEYLVDIYNNQLFPKFPLNMLHRLTTVEQSPDYHPEGNVWNHTLMVVDEAAKVRDKSDNKKVFMWAALLHDIGKYDTTKVRHGKITSYDHDKVGEKLAREFLEYFTKDNDFIDDVCALIRYHMHILYVGKNLPYADIEGMKVNTNVNEVALLGLCDRLGRLGSIRSKEESEVKKFLELCR